ncbi:MAG: MATE family efflux transporter [Eisenbergiella massiliensis]
MSLRKKLIGTKDFYKLVLSVAVPIMIQNGITNFVGLLDNIMVGQVGTEQMSGVAVANQLLFVFNICIFGAISGAGIFGAQFYGCGNYEGVRNAFRFKLWFCAALVLLGIAVFIGGGESLISLYLHESSEAGDVARTLSFGYSYLLCMLFGLACMRCRRRIPVRCVSRGDHASHEGGIAAVLVNLVLNYILIYGKFGAPALGVVGAAIATVISRYVECLIVVLWTHVHRERAPYMEGVYRTLKIPSHLIGQIVIKGLPLMLNETLWSAGMAIMMQCYSLRGLAVIAGLNISSTISNLFNVVFLALGNSVSIIIGQLLGAGKMEEAKDTDTKMIFFSVVSCLGIGAVMAVIAPLFPRMYNTTDEVRRLAEQFIWISAMVMPIQAFMHACYFTLRSGGKTFITFLFDSAFMWVVSIPLAFCLSRFSGLPIVPLYLICQMADIIKCVIGFILVKKGIWIQNFVAEEA